MAFEGKIHADTSCSYETFATIRLKNDVPEYLRYIALMPYHVTWYGYCHITFVNAQRMDVYNARLVDLNLYYIIRPAGEFNCIHSLK